MVRRFGTELFWGDLQGPGAAGRELGAAFLLTLYELYAEGREMHVGLVSVRGVMSVRGSCLCVGSCLCMRSCLCVGAASVCGIWCCVGVGGCVGVCGHVCK